MYHRYSSLSTKCIDSRLENLLSEYAYEGNLLILLFFLTKKQYFTYEESIRSTVHSELNTVQSEI